MPNIKRKMALRVHWDDPIQLSRFLANNLSQGRLALVLGAGISKPFGLPLWGELISRLYKTKRTIPPASTDLSRQADHFRERYYQNDYKGYIESVRQVLYKTADINFEVLRTYNTLGAIAALVMSSRRGSVSKVITLNYDNILEVYLAYHGFVAQSVSFDKFWEGESDVTVYHPHGFIPHETTADPSNEIILDRESILKRITDPNNSWNQKMYSILSSKFCLFIGLSGDDYALESLLYKAKGDHPALKERILNWGVAFSDKDEDSIYWSRKKIYHRKVTDYDVDLPTILFKICQDAALTR